MEQRGRPEYKNIFDVRFVSRTDVEYIRKCREGAERRRHGRIIGKRNLGEWIGSTVEKAVSRWLEDHVGPSEAPIIGWRKIEGGRGVAYFRETDFVTRPDANTILIWEIKMTTPESMARGHGLSQLAHSLEILMHGPEKNKRILRRLVYVSDNAHQVLDGQIPAVQVSDTVSEVGVVFVNTKDVERFADDLPAGWQTSEGRKGNFSEPLTYSAPEVRAPTAMALAFAACLR